MEKKGGSRHDLYGWVAGSCLLEVVMGNGCCTNTTGNTVGLGEAFMPAALCRQAKDTCEQWAHKNGQPRKNGKSHTHTLRLPMKKFRRGSLPEIKNVSWLADASIAWVHSSLSHNNNQHQDTKNNAW
jgi:hypothetical protein